MIRANGDGMTPIALEHLFAANCNETPVTSDILKRQIIRLRQEGELAIVDAYGSPRPRAENLSWTDRIVLPTQRTLFGPFGTPALQNKG